MENIAILDRVLQSLSVEVGLAPTFCFRHMYKQNHDLVNLLQPVISAMGYELWGLEYFPRGNSSLLRIYIDKVAGISLEDCTRVSDQVAGVLDVHDPISGHYNLEVSSPGLDRPLFSLEQFKRYQGYPVLVRLASKIDGRKKLSGLIEAVSADAVQINEDGQILDVPAALIEKANIKQ